MLLQNLVLSCALASGVFISSFLDHNKNITMPKYDAVVTDMNLVASPIDISIPYNIYYTFSGVGGVYQLNDYGNFNYKLQFGWNNYDYRYFRFVDFSTEHNLSIYNENKVKVYEDSLVQDNIFSDYMYAINENLEIYPAEEEFFNFISLVDFLPFISMEKDTDNDYYLSYHLGLGGNNEYNTSIDIFYINYISGNSTLVNNVVYDFRLDNVVNTFSNIINYVRNAFEDGYTQGFEDGKTLGYNNGYSDGYATGYDTGFNANSTAVTVFSGILNVALVPINFFLAIFNFEILDINISALVSAILSIACVVIVIKTFTGKGGN